METAALTEQGVRVLGDVPELLPPLSRLSIEAGGSLAVASGLGELRPGRDLSVLVDGARARPRGRCGRGSRNLDAFGKALGECRVAEGQRGTYLSTEISRVEAAELSDFTQEGMRPLMVASGEQQAAADPERVGDRAW